MATLEVAATTRQAMKKNVKKLRREGIIPAVLYGPKLQGVQPLSLTAREFARIFAQAGSSTLLRLKVEGRSAQQVLIHQVQYDHLHRNLTHVDFYAPDMTVELALNVPLAFTGEAPAVDMHDGIVIHLVSELHVRALPGNIPAAIEVDMGGLTEIGSQLTAGDIPLPANVALAMDAEEIIVRINAPTVVEEPEVAEAAEAAGEETTEEAAAESEADPEESQG
jgi:large subunit ribosomal protein L25